MVHADFRETEDTPLASPYDHIPDEIKREAAADTSKKTAVPTMDPPEGKAPEKGDRKKDKKGKSIFQRTKAGVLLTREEVKEIRIGRKKLRKEMKQRKIYSKREFELLASSMGLYFDKRNPLAFLKWFLHGKGLWALLGALFLLFFAMVTLAYVSQLRGHFTINMSEDMFKSGFLMSETRDFTNPTTHLFSKPAEDVPCVSITDIAQDVDEVDGSHNEDYFAYTFYLRYEGDESVTYDWTINLNSESQSISVAAWLMVFEDGKLSIFAKASADGGAEMLPKVGDDRHGYPEPFFRKNLADPDQLQLIRTVGSVSYYRVEPYTFESANTIAKGSRAGVEPGDVHKYTVVMWLEGDDPECTDELIGGHMGVEMNMRMRDETGEEKESWLDRFLGNLIWWDK